ncbi:flagellar basal body P-ring formation chaperone FlgA [Burkholderia stagnalis]
MNAATPARANLAVTQSTNAANGMSSLPGTNAATPARANLAVTQPTNAANGISIPPGTNAATPARANLAATQSTNAANGIPIPSGRAAARPAAPVYAAAHANAAYAAPRAAAPSDIVTVVAGTAEPASNSARTPQQAALAAHLAAARAASAARMPTAPAASASRTPPPAASAAAVAAFPTTPPGQQDPDALRRTALAFLQQQIAGLPGKTTATVAPAFPRGLAACTTLEPFLPTGARLWGRTTVGVRCAGERPWTIYLQAKVAVQAAYYVAARQIAPGEPLTAADLVARDGDLTALPLAVITDPAQAIGATALARIPAGLPLRQDLLKSAASVSAGQSVRVVAAGPGFTISAEGSALANAAPGQSVRVRMAAGQIVTAIVKDAGTVEIPM